MNYVTPVTMIESSYLFFRVGACSAVLGLTPGSVLRNQASRDHMGCRVRLNSGWPACKAVALPTLPLSILKKAYELFVFLLEEV